MKIRIELTRSEYQPIESIDICAADEITARDMIDVMAAIMFMMSYHPQSIYEACHDYGDEHQPVVYRNNDCEDDTEEES